MLKQTPCHRRSVFTVLIADEDHLSEGWFVLSPIGKGD